MRNLKEQGKSSSPRDQEGNSFLVSKGQKFSFVLLFKSPGVSIALQSSHKQGRDTAVYIFMQSYGSLYPSISFIGQ